MSLLAVSGLTTGAAVLAVGTPLLFRQRAYRRLLNYDPRQDCVAPFDPAAVETIAVSIDSSGTFALPKRDANWSSALLELNVQATSARRDPVVEINAGGFRDRQVLERGVRGVRFLNLTRLLHAAGKSDEKVHLQGSGLTWNGTARLHICRHRVQPGERVLVISPHPDDAEIAAFGLYSETDSAVVTLTAGDASDRYSGHNGMSARLDRATIARVRVWDSLTVPQLAGVPAEQVINLAYPDGRLSEMESEPDRNFDDRQTGEPDFQALRRMNRSPWLRTDANSSWRSLVADLARIIEEMQPTIIATPHPWLDPHSDHRLATLAVSEALSSSKREGRFFFYMCHNRRSEMWPFGPAGSGVAMLPIFADDLVGCDGFYSHSLTPQRQQAKFLALEAMHDLRDIGSPEPRMAGVHLRRARAELVAALHGPGRPSTSYLRRAVRPDELFLTASFAKGQDLCARLMRENGTVAR